MEANFSPRVRDVITFSREEALRLGHDYIGTEHFLLGIIREGEGTAIRILKSLGVTVLDLRKMVEQSIAVDNSKSNSNGNIPLVKQAEKTLKRQKRHLRKKSKNAQPVLRCELLLVMCIGNLETNLPQIKPGKKLLSSYLVTNKKSCLWHFYWPRSTNHGMPYKHMK